MTVPATASPLSLLVCDDEAPALARLRDLLSDIAPELPNEIVAEADNGLRALAAVEGRRVDVALVDIRMPKMDGIELARHLSRLEHPP
ncbi:MAG TPA: response regulator, partial [Accumulibacter sp.]|nr:response regulator [Accumulibacter sp.]